MTTYMHDRKSRRRPERPYRVDAYGRPTQTHDALDRELEPDERDGSLDEPVRGYN